HKFQSVIVDAEGYRKRREETLMDLANKMAEKSIQLNKKISLEPMPAYERKIIHSALQETNTITTFSEGREPHRYIRSEEHTSELQSRFDLVCRLLLEKKNKRTQI